MSADLLSWPEVAQRLAEPRNYWLVTTGPDGAPHTAPVWGAVTGDLLHLYSVRATRKARNLARDPRLLVHLESGEDVLIVHGVAEDLGTPGDVPAVVAAFAAKYTEPGDADFLPGADPTIDVIRAVHPGRVLTWRLADFPASQRRWSAG